jgi:hypothetical protein
MVAWRGAVALTGSMLSVCAATEKTMVNKSTTSKFCFMIISFFGLTIL